MGFYLIYSIFILDRFPDTRISPQTIHVAYTFSHASKLQANNRMRFHIEYICPIINSSDVAHSVFAIASHCRNSNCDTTKLSQTITRDEKEMRPKNTTKFHSQYIRIYFLPLSLFQDTKHHTYRIVMTVSLNNNRTLLARGLKRHSTLIYLQ